MPIPLVVAAASCTALAMSGTESDASGAAALMIVSGIAALVAAATRWWMTTTSGPVLGVSGDGIWIRLRRARGEAMFLPWREIESMSVEPTLLGAVLRVIARRREAATAALLAPLACTDHSRRDVIDALKRHGPRTNITY